MANDRFLGPSTDIMGIFMAIIMGIFVVCGVSLMDIIYQETTKCPLGEIF